MQNKNAKSTLKEYRNLNSEFFEGDDSEEIRINGREELVDTTSSKFTLNQPEENKRCTYCKKEFPESMFLAHSLDCLR